MPAPGTKPPGPRVDAAITALTVRKGRSDRVAVHLEGLSVLELATALVDQAGLRKGQLLTAEAQDRLVEQDAPHRARSRALRLLALRDRSRSEVESRLLRLGYDAKVIADTVAWLEGLGYLDESRFAMGYAAARLKAGWGERLVRAELRRAGVDRALIDRALETEGANAQAAVEGAGSVLAKARRRFGPQFATDPEVAERRLAGFLLRRGCDWETISSVAAALRLESGAGSPKAGPGPDAQPDPWCAGDRDSGADS